MTTTTLLTRPESCDYCQAMNEPLGSERIPDDDDVDRETTRKLMRSIQGARPVLIGIDQPGWQECSPDKPCAACDSGRKVEAHKYAVCLACTRASKALDRAIKRALTEQEALVKFYDHLRAVAIKQRALLQKMRRRGVIEKPGRGNHGADPGRAMFARYQAYLDKRR